MNEPRLINSEAIVEEMNRLIARGQRVRELAWRAQVDESTIRRLRNGTARSIRVDNAERLADAMGTPLVLILETHAVTHALTHAAPGVIAGL